MSFLFLERLGTRNFEARPLTTHHHLPTLEVIDSHVGVGSFGVPHRRVGHCAVIVSWQENGLIG